MTTVLVLLAVALVLLPVGFVRTALRIRRSDGFERALHRNSYWFLGGSLVLLAAIGLSVLAGPSPLPYGLLASSVVLNGVGAARSRRLTAGRGQELLEAAAAAETLVERVDALEHRRGLIPRPSPWSRFILGAGNLTLATTAAYVALATPRSGSALAFAAVSASAIAWLGWDIVVHRRREARRAEISADIDAALGITRGNRRAGPSAREADG